MHLESEGFPQELLQLWGGLCPLPSTSGPPGNGDPVCLVFVCPGATKRVSGCCMVCVDPFLMSRYHVRQPAKQWDFFPGVSAICPHSFQESTIKGRLGERGNPRVPRCSSPCDRSPEIYGGVPWAPSPLGGSFWDLLSVLVLIQFHPRNFVRSRKPYKNRQ